MRTGVGKTVFILGLGCSLATGRPWLGRAVRPTRVLFVIGEGAYGLHDRITAWEQAWNNGEPISDDRFTVLVKPESLARRATWLELTEYAVTGQYGAVFLDTFSSLAPDADEVKDAPLVMRHLNDLSVAVNGTALMVHHPGWSDNGRARGGYQLEANADEVLILKGGPESPLVEVTRKKAKNEQSGGRFWLKRVPSHGSVLFEVASTADSDVPLRERVLGVLIDYAETGATGPQVVTELGMKEHASSVYRAIRRGRRGLGGGRRQARSPTVLRHRTRPGR